MPFAETSCPVCVLLVCVNVILRRALNGKWTEIFDKGNSLFSLEEFKHLQWHREMSCAPHQCLASVSTVWPQIAEQHCMVLQLNLHLPMLRACDHSVSHFVLIISLEAAVFNFEWVLKKSGSVIFTFLKLEQTLKIHCWEIPCDVYYLSMESVSLSGLYNNLQLNASASQRHESTFVVFYLVRYENLGAHMHT